MALLVQKFGGTSVGDIDRIAGVAARIAASLRDGHQVVAVVSAMAGETDRLLRLALESSRHGRPNPRELDALLATGEQASSALLCMSLEGEGITARSYTGWQAGIQTDARHARARITRIDTAALQADVERGRVPVVAGFQGVTDDGSISTLGRGGSDTTAVQLAAALGASECQIFTDVDGVYTADPRVVPEARRLSRIAVAPMLEMAREGSKVLQRHSVEAAAEHAVRLRVLSTFEAGEGTLVLAGPGEPGVGRSPLGVACRRDVALLRLAGAVADGTSFEQLTALLDSTGLEVDFLHREVADASEVGFTWCVTREDFELARERLEQAFAPARCEGNRKLAKISLLGVGPDSHASIAAQAGSILESAALRWHARLGTSTRVSFLVDEDDADRAARALHNGFDLHRPD